jgi:Prokaryotic homologs of the JAB domain
MTEPGFRIESRQQTAPFLARDTFSDYYRFGDAKCAILVEPAAALAMRAAAEWALPRETGGLLSGRALHDDQGSYVVVSGFIEAEQTAGQVATFHITATELGVLRTSAARANPGADEVGWWHSHRGSSSYSQVDLNTQRMFERDDSVGLLVFAGGKHLAAAYMGPNAHGLGYAALPKGRPAEPAVAVGPARAPDSAESGNPADHRDRPAGYPGPTAAAAAAAAGPTPKRPFTIPSPPAQRSRPSEQAILWIILLVIFVVMLILLVALLSDVGDISARFGSLQQSLSGQVNHLANADSNDYKQLSGQVASANPVPTATPQATSSPSPAAPSVVTVPSVSWSCYHVSSNNWNCSAATSPKTTSGWTVDWKVGSNDNVGGGRIAVPLGVGKNQQVDAILVSPTGQKYPGAPQTLTP